MGRHIPRPGRAALAVGAAAVALTYTAIRFPSYPDPPGTGGAAEPEPGDLAAEAVAARSAAKHLVVREVIAGRMALPDAAARFGWLNALPPPFRAFPQDGPASEPWLPDRGGFTEAEWLAAQVVEWVANEVREDHRVRAGEVRARLVGEFWSARAAGRPARLPEVPEGERARLLERAEAEAARRRVGGSPAPAPAAVAAE
jgi:hypothetical protein